MERSGESTTRVPRGMIFSLIFAPLFPGFAAVVNIIGDPRFRGVRSLDVVKLMAIGWCAGIVFSGILLLISSKFHRGYHGPA